MVLASAATATADGSPILPPSLPVVVDDARKTMFLLHYSHHESIHFLMLLATLLARHTSDKPWIAVGVIYPPGPFLSHLICPDGSTIPLIDSRMTWSVNGKQSPLMRPTTSLK